MAEWPYTWLWVVCQAIDGLSGWLVDASMAGFDLEAFISAPTLEQLDKFRKDDLISIAAHFQISVLKQQLKTD